MLKILKKRSQRAIELGLDLNKEHPDDCGHDIPVLWPEEYGGAIALRPGEKRDIPSGIYIHIPTGYWAEIKARGSSFNTRRLHIHDAVWDAGYNGEIMVGVINMGDTPITIRDGERLAQLIPHEVVDVEWEDTEEEFPDTPRNLNHNGSSGL
jgi:dUTP pyrophosphatase